MNELCLMRNSSSNSHPGPLNSHLAPPGRRRSRAPAVHGCPGPRARTRASMVHRMAQIPGFFRGLLMDAKHRRNLSSMASMRARPSVHGCPVHVRTRASMRAWGMRMGAWAPHCVSPRHITSPRLRGEVDFERSEKSGEGALPRALDELNSSVVGIPASAPHILEMPPHPALRADLSPQAGRGEARVTPAP